MVSIKDVAKRAGVSISTVSNVLNGTKYVSEILKQKVQIAVQELNYEVDPVARNMKVKKTKTIGVITVDMCGLFYPYVVKGIYEKANKYGYSIIICDTNGINDSVGSMEREMQSFKKLISNRVDGIIFASTVPKHTAAAYINEIKKMASLHKKIPLVAIEQDFSYLGIDSVFADGFEGGRKATEHLIACGCKKIGHITGPIFSSVAMERAQGFLSILKESKIAFDENINVANGNYTHQSGYLAMNELLRKIPEIDGVFIANDQMAVGALRALSEHKKNVPEDVKVIGYDNVFISSILEPSLSTVHVRKKNIGLMAMELLLKKIDGEESDTAQRIKMETRLVVRKSTSEEGIEDWILGDW